jgi:foldase protein PrsA
MRSTPAGCVALGLLLLTLTACGTTTGDDGQLGDPPPATQAAGDGQAPASDGKPLAYLNGEPITERALQPRLVEAAGGRVLTELVLGRLVENRLDQAGITLTDKQIEAERKLVLNSLASDENQSVVLLNQLRRQRGLGETRFQALLRRNAGLRQLVKDEVSVNDAAIRKAYKRRYGPRYEGRILVRPRAQQVRRLKGKLKDGADFATLAARHSTDPSATQGGLLSPISPADATYPKIIRDTLKGLAEGAVSDVIAVEGGYAILKLERKIQARPVKLADVRDRLKRQVRRRLQRNRMGQLARSMLSEANIVVLNSALSDRWQQHKQDLLQTDE